MRRQGPKMPTFHEFSPACAIEDARAEVPILKRIYKLNVCLLPPQNARQRHRAFTPNAPLLPSAIQGARRTRRHAAQMPAIEAGSDCCEVNKGSHNLSAALHRSKTPCNAFQLGGVRACLGRSMSARSENAPCTHRRRW